MTFVLNPVVTTMKSLAFSSAFKQIPQMIDQSIKNARSIYHCGQLTTEKSCIQSITESYGSEAIELTGVFENVVH